MKINYDTLSPANKTRVRRTLAEQDSEWVKKFDEQVKEVQTKAGTPLPAQKAINKVEDKFNQTKIRYEKRIRELEDEIERIKNDNNLNDDQKSLMLRQSEGALETNKKYLQQEIASHQKSIKKLETLGVEEPAQTFPNHSAIPKEYKQKQRFWSLRKDRRARDAASEAEPREAHYGAGLQGKNVVRGHHEVPIEYPNDPSTKLNVPQTISNPNNIVIKPKVKRHIPYTPKPYHDVDPPLVPQKIPSVGDRVGSAIGKGVDSLASGNKKAIAAGIGAFGAAIVGGAFAKRWYDKRKIRVGQQQARKEYNDALKRVRQTNAATINRLRKKQLERIRTVKLSNKKEVAKVQGLAAQQIGALQLTHQQKLKTVQSKVGSLSSKLKKTSAETQRYRSTIQAVKKVVK